MRTPLLAVLAVVVTVVLTACSSGGDPESGGTGTPLLSPDARSTPAQAEKSPLKHTSSPLDWQPTALTPDQQVIQGTRWTAVVGASGNQVRVQGEDTEHRLDAGPGRQVGDVLLDDRWAVAVMQDRQEQRPSRAVVLDLDSGATREVDSPRPANGGSWAMHDGVLRYPIWGPGRTWCLAEVSLGDLSGESRWCAEPRTGWSNLSATQDGVALMTFDDRRPVACRSVNLLDNAGRPRPVEGPTDCLAWDVAAVDGGVVWSEVPRAREQESATFHARVDGETVDLGPGVTGSLTACGPAVFWAQDPQRADGPASLMRWQPGGQVETAYESEARGTVFLGEPSCAAGVLTLASFSEDGDEQVWANAR